MRQYQLFLDSIRSPETKKVYTIYFNKFLNFMGEQDLFCGDNPRQIERHIIDFIISLKERGLGYFAIRNYVMAITSFYKINDIVLNTAKIGKFMPEYKRIKKDRGYTHEEIRKLLQIADERMGVIILLLSSSGMRIGALSTLRLRNLENRKLTVYENTNEEYITFITPECRQAIDLYIDMRCRYGENISGNSFLIREQFDVRTGAAFTKPRCIGETAIQIKLIDLSKRAGVRTKDVPIAHGFRKFFTTQLVNSKLNPEIREMLLGHKIGLASAYYRPTEDEMYSEYEKAIDNLTIDPANRLQRKVEVLTLEKSKVDLALMQIEEMKKRIGLD